MYFYLKTLEVYIGLMSHTDSQYSEMMHVLLVQEKTILFKAYFI